LDSKHFFATNSTAKIHFLAGFTILQDLYSFFAATAPIEASFLGKGTPLTRKDKN